jgi:tRNA pseudouridine13 synthase
VVSVERSGLPVVTMFKSVTVGNVAEMNKAVAAGKVRLALPLIGFKQRPSLGMQGEIEEQILEEEDIRPEDFRTEALPEIVARGELRTAMTPLNSFSVDEIARDSIDPSRHVVRVGFALYRGSYATVVLRELMKARDPIAARF